MIYSLFMSPIKPVVCQSLIHKQAMICLAFKLKRHSELICSLNEDTIGHSMTVLNNRGFRG
jgi:hypothetical protein